MGKIRVKTLGLEEVEQKEKKEAKKRQETKSASRRTTKAPGMKGGERVVAVGPSEEEITKLLEEEQLAEPTPSAESPQPAQEKTKKAAKKRQRSKHYQTVAQLVEGQKAYSLEEALTLLPKLKLSRFDETVELHINTKENGVSGTLTLPHGTGRKTRVAIATDSLISAVEKGKIDFDVLVAEPSMMQKLAKVAKVLGPRGLMPNPKAGTIADEPQEAVKRYEKGQLTFRTEAKAPVIHLTVGKLSFGQDKLSENIKAALSAVNPVRIRKVVLKSTMSPGIKVDISSI